MKELVWAPTRSVPKNVHGYSFLILVPEIIHLQDEMFAMLKNACGDEHLSRISV
jgi:hypothetical protein